MKITGRRLDFMTEDEIRRIVDYALRIIDEIGMQIEHRAMCERLADSGCEWDGEFRVRFPRRLMENYLEREKLEPPSPSAAEEMPVEGAISGYPLRTIDPHDLELKFHTVRTVVDITRLCDWLPNIHGIGMVGVPSDIPPLLRPFWMRLIDWRYAERTLANGYVIWDAQLCPHIAEFCETVGEMEPQNGGMDRYFRANNYVVSPLRYPRAEAEQFVWFWRHGYRCTIGNLVSMGAASPVTLAGSIGLNLAENIALSWMHHVFYGDRGLRLYGRPVPLDMRTGYMPYGRPEETLAALAMSQVVDYLGTGEAGGLGHCTAAKQADVECGLNKAFNAGLEIVLLGRLHYGFGLISTDEVNDPRLIVIENEFVEGLRHLGRGFEVTDDTLPFDVVKEVGPGGSFLGHPHTAEHFREELWIPDLFSGESHEQWLRSGGTPILEKARRKVLDVYETYHPRGIKEATEEKLLSLIDGYAKKLGITDYRRPELPE